MCCLELLDEGEKPLLDFFRSWIGESIKDVCLAVCRNHHIGKVILQAAVASAAEA